MKNILDTSQVVLYIEGKWSGAQCLIVEGYIKTAQHC